MNIIFKDAIAHGIEVSETAEVSYLKAGEDLQAGDVVQYDDTRTDQDMMLGCVHFTANTSRVLAGIVLHDVSEGNDVLVLTEGWASGVRLTTGSAINAGDPLSINTDGTVSPAAAGILTPIRAAEDTPATASTIKVVLTFTETATGGGSGSGESNTASNLGTGEGLYSQKVGVDLQFKSIVAGTNVTLSATGSELTINSTASGTVNDLQDAYEGGNTITTDAAHGDFDISGTQNISLRSTVGDLNTDVASGHHDYSGDVYVNADAGQYTYTGGVTTTLTGATNGNASLVIDFANASADANIALTATEVINHTAPWHTFENTGATRSYSIGFDDFGGEVFFVNGFNDNVVWKFSDTDNLFSTDQKFLIDNYRNPGSGEEAIFAIRDHTDTAAGSQNTLEFIDQYDDGFTYFNIWTQGNHKLIFGTDGETMETTMGGAVNVLNNDSTYTGNGMNFHTPAGFYGGAGLKFGNDDAVFTAGYRPGLIQYQTQGTTGNNEAAINYMGLSFFASASPSLSLDRYNSVHVGVNYSYDIDEQFVVNWRGYTVPVYDDSVSHSSPSDEAKYFFLDGHASEDRIYLYHVTVSDDSSSPQKVDISRYEASTTTWTTIATGVSLSSYNSLGTIPTTNIKFGVLLPNPDSGRKNGDYWEFTAYPDVQRFAVKEVTDGRETDVLVKSPAGGNINLKVDTDGWTRAEFTNSDSAFGYVGHCDDFGDSRDFSIYSQTAYAVVIGAGTAGFKVYNLGIETEVPLYLKEQSVGGNIAGYGQLYVDSSDSHLYFVEHDGTSHDLTTSGSGEANTASNLGGDQGLYASKSGVDLQFKGLTAGSGISLSADGTAVTISATGSGSDLQSAYEAGSTITTDATHGALTITGDQAVDVTTTGTMTLGAGLTNMTKSVQQSGNDARLTINKRLYRPVVGISVAGTTISTSQTSTYANVFTVEATAGDVNVQLDNSYDGRTVTLVRSSSSVYATTVNGINGNSIVGGDIVLTDEHPAATLVCSGTDWYVVGTADSEDPYGSRWETTFTAANAGTWQKLTEVRSGLDYVFMPNNTVVTVKGVITAVEYNGSVFNDIKTWDVFATLRCDNSGNVVQVVSATDNTTGGANALVKVDKNPSGNQGWTVLLDTGAWQAGTTKEVVKATFSVVQTIEP